MTDLGVLNAAAYGINPPGRLLETRTIARSSTSGGFPLDRSSFQHVLPYSYSDRMMIDPGTLGGMSSWAMRINITGQIVGTAQTANRQYDAFLYEHGVMIDLNSLLPSNSGWQLSVASAINDTGQIGDWEAIPRALHTRFFWVREAIALLLGTGVPSRSPWQKTQQQGPDP